MTAIYVAEVAEMCGVTPVTIRTWADAGYLPCKIVKDRGDREFDQDVIKTMIERGQTPSPGRVGYPLLPLIWSRVEQAENGCWIYTGRIGGQGYGVLSLGPRETRRVAGVHVLMYEEVIGPIPAGLHLDHVCHSIDKACPGGVCSHRSCCNPWHLEPVTRRENLLRGRGFPAIHAIKTHCVHGHEFTPQNTMREKYGRKCRTCHNSHEARRRARIRAEKAVTVIDWSVTEQLDLMELAS